MRRSCTLAAALGCLGGSWMWLLQTCAAWLGGHVWALESPGWSLLVHVAGLGLLAALATVPLELARRVLLPRVDPGALLALAIGFGGYLLRSLSSIELSFGGGRIVQAALLACVAVAIWLVARRLPPLTDRQVLLLGGSIFAIELSFAYLVHLAFLADRQAPQIPGGAAGALVLLSLGAAAGLAGALALALPKRHLALRCAAALVGLLAVGLYLSSRHQSPRRQAGRTEGPNVLLIVIDTLRRDAVGAYGVIAGATPNLDELAAGGVLWTDAVANSNWTVPAHATLFTGAQVTRHGTGGGGRRRLRPYPAGPGTALLPTLAEIFEGQGFTTGAFVCNPNLSRANAFDRGFQEYYEIWQYRSGTYDLLGLLAKKILGFGDRDQGGAMVTRALQGFFSAASRRTDPWFLFVNTLEPHAPYAPPEPWRSRFAPRPISWDEASQLSRLVLTRTFGPYTDEQRDLLWSLYLASVAYQDHLLGQALEALDASGLHDETIVLVTSDHGENFGWQGHLSHGQSLNDDLIRVPLIGRGPGLPVGVRSDAPVSLVDIMPTLLELVRLPPGAADPGKTGVTMPPIGPALPADRARVVERYDFSRDEIRNRFADPDKVSDWWQGSQSALLAGAWKLHRFGAGRGPRLTRLETRVRPPTDDGRVEVTGSPLQAEMLERLHQLEASWSAAQPPEASEGPLDERTRRQLEALGYLGD